MLGRNRGILFVGLLWLEGYIDRQMIDYLPHDSADYVLQL